jgi:peroxiredoxin
MLSCPTLTSLPFLKEGYKKLDFSFPGINGKQVSLSDDKYKGKVVIVEIIGTWCPNCTDQTVFLSPWFNKNHGRGVEAIALGFEQKDSLEYAKYTLGKLRINMPLTTTSLLVVWPIKSWYRKNCLRLTNS